MKKIFLLITMITLSIITTNAQVSFGLKAGLNISSVSNLTNNSATVGTTTATNKTKLKLGGQFGAYANIHFGKILGLQPELLFSMKGYKYESKSVVGNVEARSTSDVRINYIEIPLQLRVNPTENFYLLAGPYFGILAGASSTNTSYSSVPPIPPVTTTSKSTSTNGLKSLDLGIAVGLGFKAENGFTMGLKYSRAFSSIYANDSGTPHVNSVFQVFAGFEFGGKR